MTDFVLDLFQGTPGAWISSRVGSGDGQTGTHWAMTQTGVGTSKLVLAAGGGAVLETPSESAALYYMTDAVVPAIEYDVEMLVEFNDANGKVVLYNKVGPATTILDADGMTPILLVAPDTLYVGPNSIFDAPIHADGAINRIVARVNGKVVTAYINDVEFFSYDFGAAQGDPYLLDEADNKFPNPDYVPESYGPLNTTFGLYVSLGVPGTPELVKLHSFRIGTPSVFSRFWKEFVGASEA